MSATRVKFGDVVRKVNDKIDPSLGEIERYVAGDHMDTDELKILRFGLVGDGYLGPAFHMRFKPGHILYGSRRTYLRKVAMADFEGVCANTTFVIEPRDSRLSARYLIYVMSTERFHQNSISLSKGSTNPYINFSDLANFEFELPSIEEQQRIVELLSGVDAHAEALRNQLNVAQETRKSVLHQLLTAGGEDWTETTLGSISSFVGVRKKPSDLPAETPFLGLDHVDSRTRLVSRTGEIREVVSQVTPFEPGDTLFGKLRPNLHKVSFSTFPGVCSTEILVIRAREECIPEFLYLTSSWDETVAYCVDKSAGTKMPRVSPRDLSSLVIQLPPMQEQQRIVGEISKIDAVIQETTSALAATRQLRNALLNKEIS